MKRINKRLSGATSSPSAKESQNSIAFRGGVEKFYKSLHTQERQPLLPVEVHEIMNSVIARHHLVLGNSNLRYIYDHIINLINRENELRDSGYQLPFPSLSTVYREFRKSIELYKIVRFGKGARFSQLSKKRKIAASIGIILSAKK